MLWCCLIMMLLCLSQAREVLTNLEAGRTLSHAGGAGGDSDDAAPAVLEALVKVVRYSQKHTAFPNKESDERLLNFMRSTYTDRTEKSLGTPRLSESNDFSVSALHCAAPLCTSV